MFPRQYVPIRKHSLLHVPPQAVPTPSHMSLVALASAGKLKYLVSQNRDGLHRKSGIPPFLISELHGNTNREYCKNCGKEYIRDYSTGARNADLRDHRWGAVHGFSC